MRSNKNKLGIATIIFSLVSLMAVFAVLWFVHDTAAHRIGTPDGYVRMWTSHYVTSGETLSEIAEDAMDTYDMNDMGFRNRDYVKELIEMNDLRPDGQLIEYGYSIAIPYFVTEEEAMEMSTNNAQ